MSILIKGMEMPPKGEYDCTIRVWSDGTAMLYGNTDLIGGGELIELPPHGRLIDADALMKDGWTLHKQVMRMGGYAIHEMPLNNPNVSIVIPADKDGET